MVLVVVVVVLIDSIVLQKRMRKYAADHAPLQRTPVSGDVGAVTAFLASDLASSISGQTIYGEGFDRSGTEELFLTNALCCRVSSGWRAERNGSLRAGRERGVSQHGVNAGTTARVDPDERLSADAASSRSYP
jgi:hypothetical protein